MSSLKLFNDFLCTGEQRKDMQKVIFVDTKVILRGGMEKKSLLN